MWHFSVFSFFLSWSFYASSYFPLTSCRHLMDIRASHPGDITHCHASTVLIHKPIFLSVNVHAVQHTNTSINQTDQSLFKLRPGSKTIIKWHTANSSTSAQLNTDGNPTEQTQLCCPLPVCLCGGPPLKLCLLKTVGLHSSALLYGHASVL